VIDRLRSVPALALLAALACLPLEPGGVALGPLTLAPSEILVVLAAAASGLLWLAGRGPSGLRPTAFDVPLILFLSSALLSLAVTEYWRLSLRELRTLVLVPVLAYELVVLWLADRSAGLPLGAFLLGSVAVAAAGLAGAPFGRGVVEAEGVTRIAGTYPSANHLALVLGRTLPWLVALAWLGGHWRAPALAGAAVVGLALALTFSRGGWIAGAVAVVVVTWGIGGRRWVALIGGPLALLGGLAMLLRGGETAIFRVHLWQSSLAMIRDHLLLGVGLDNFLYLYQQRYVRPEALAEANLSHPHNLVLHFWLELGLLGLLAGLWLLWRAVRLIALMAGPTNDRWTRAMALGAAGSLADFAVHGMIDNSYFLPDLAIVFWLTLALLEHGRRERLQLPVAVQRTNPEWR
jgi:O-antigen ligase